MIKNGVQHDCRPHRIIIQLHTYPESILLSKLDR